MKDKKQLLRINLNYSAVQGSFWASYCALATFTAVYLSYRGLNNTTIGLTTSLTSLISIFLQFVLSDWSDRHFTFPIRKLIFILFLVSVCLGAVIQFIPLPVAFMVVVYASSMSLAQCNNGFLNAQLMQFNNVGIPANYGVARGIGSVCYAAASYIFGALVERFTPGILLPIFLIGSLITAVFVICMPNPYKGIDYAAYGLGTSKKDQVSYKKMITGNRALIVYLVAVILLGVGQSSSFTFMIRVVESLGGGSREYGLSELIRAGVEVPMLFASAFLLARFNGKKLLTLCFFAQAARIAMIALAPAVGLIYFANACNLFCSGIYIFASVYYVNSIVGPMEKVRAQSLSALCVSMGSILGNTMAGVMIDTLGLRPMLLTAAAICACSGLIMVLFREKKKA